MKNKNFDIIIIGAGHAGCEAAHIAAKYNLNILLCTNNLDNIAKLSCNPAIGGIAKGQVVREIDILGGIMAKIADKSSIQFRVLNKKKGLAVQSPRSQADKYQYNKNMLNELSKISNLYMINTNIISVDVYNDKFKVKDEIGNEFIAKSVIICTGTFLNGKMYFGFKTIEAGRLGDFPAKRLSDSLKRLNIDLIRFKTGTPPRILNKGIDFSYFEEQYGDSEPVRFSLFHRGFEINNQAICYSNYTSEKTSEIIRNNLDKSPLYSGVIKGIGPRYCPSIEDKIVKFPHHKRHLIFLEPETIEANEFYINGISSSLPIDVQEQVVRSIPGLENCFISRYAYGIEYDCINPNILNKTLEHKRIKNLFFAGQINGTSGYEEAAAQGLTAGINAARNILNKTPFILTRYNSYIGVLIDDITKKGVNEPYRLFTSSAEYRLNLRIDNAIYRLGNIAIEFDLYNEKEKELYYKFIEEKEKYIKGLKSIKINIKEIIKTSKTDEKKTIFDIFKYPNIDLQIINKYIDLNKYDKNIVDNVLCEQKYSGYLKRQCIQIEKMKKLEKIHIPDDIDYYKINELSNEAKEKLSKAMPKNLLEALNMPGVLPGHIEVLSIYLKKINESK